MPPIAGDAIDGATKFAWDAAIKWGFGTVALVAISVTLWMSFDKQNVYIRETMAADSKAQTKVIEQNSLQLQQNSAVLETVLDNNKVTLEVVNKALDVIEDHQK